MIYTPLTKKAMVLAYHAHHGQVDKSGTPYMKQNPIARQVKLFDLLHNSDQTRCAFLPAKKRAQLKEKYDRALAILRRP